MIRRHHDMGGLDAGPVEPADHVFEPWERRVHAIQRLLTGPKGVMTVDELRRGIEDLGPGLYDSLGYYERWIASIANILVEKGMFTVDELGRKIAEVEAAWRKEQAR